jgi:hypothetical protein
MTERDYLAGRVYDESLVEFAKAKKDLSEYRDSNLAAFNPRSKTEVRRGTMPQRFARQAGGAVIGAGAGAALTRKVPFAGGTVGGAVGGSLGRAQNLKSGDTRATHRRTGRKARGALNLGQLGNYWTY